MITKIYPFRIMIIIVVCIFLSASFMIKGESKPQENLSDYNKKLNNSIWPMFHYNAQRIGRCPYGPDITFSCPELKWSIYTDDGGSETSPAISSDGTIYLGIMDFHKSVMAINPNGTEKWSFNAGNHIQSSPAIGEDGTIYFGSEGSNLYALYPNGSIKWCTHIGAGWVKSSPVIDQNGIIYCAAVIGSNVCAVYPNGTIKWSFQTDGWVYSSPTIALDGTVYIGSNDCYLYSINQNGGLNWRYKVGDYIQDTAAISLDGTIYFGSWDGYLYALYPNGDFKWKVDTGRTIDESSPAIAADGTIYIGSLNGRITSIFPNGTIKWVFQTGDEVYSSPTIDSNGIIYCGSNNGYLYALNPDGTLRWKYNTGTEIMPCSPVINEDGTIYIANWGPYFQAVRVIGNSKPSIPTINGILIGKIKQSYEYKIYSTDPENENISYYVDWGDGTNSGWTRPYPSGQEQILNHTWNKKGTYMIKAKARDIHDQESDWGILSVRMPYEPPQFPFLHWLLERFPNAFPLLRYLMEN
jgi:outer membrane protein assembly factor BamB